MFIHTRGSATKRFAKFGMQKRTFCGKKRKKLLAKSSQTDYSHINFTKTFMFLE